MAHYQPKITAFASPIFPPAHLAWKNTIGTLANYYNKTSSDERYQPLTTVSTPLSISSSNGLSIDLTGYQPKITTFSSPILYSANTLSFDNTIDTLANYSTTSSSDAKYQQKIITTTPLSLSASSALSIDLTGYAATTSLTGYQPTITTFSSPILYNNISLSFDQHFSVVTNYYVKNTYDSESRC